MRIGYFVWEYPPWVVSGLGSCVESICQAMINKGLDVSVFTMNDGTLKTREVLNGVDINRHRQVEKYFTCDKSAEYIAEIYEDVIMGAGRK